MTGTVLPFAGTAAPTGWLLCYGQSLLRADYPNLFTAIGTTYGAADGTHFNVPDLRGRSPIGKDDMGGSAAGILTVTLTGTKASTSSGVITGLSSTANLAVGMKATGTGIGTNAVISSIDSATQVTLSVNSTGTGSGSIVFAVIDGATLGAVGGSHVHKLTVTQLPQHRHNLGQTTSLPGTTPGAAQAAGPTAASWGLTGYSGGDENHPNLHPSMVLNHIIKT